MSISLKSMAEPGRQAPIEADLRSRSSLDVVLVLKRASQVTRPVDLALKLKKFGLGLQDAHRALNHIVADEVVQLRLGNADRTTMIAELAELGVAAE
ncbi:hypothetical protein D3273_16785 [Lichenibacterium minor]|uniref:Uncharacterized protein n=1 Tax=Lichenibacterium minor TaxID=2316528 RepID=A0A4Q2U2X3_9HYPH|nr:hypothetical protein [Lichenibacterium minor]RYC30843.1 hypothetical protein D3273_16785 [Lichenibacterium minor]